MRSLWATLVALCVVTAAPAVASADGRRSSDDRIERAVSVAAAPATAPSAIKLRRRAAAPDVGLGPFVLAALVVVVVHRAAIASAGYRGFSRPIARPLVDPRSSRGPPLG